jgi:hypothetical protein
MKKIYLPNNKKFVFTIIDDSDDSFLENTKPIYDFLFENGIFITKTIWVYPPRDRESKGHSLQHEGYRAFILDIKNKGYEIALHCVGSGQYFRKEILQGLEEYKNFFGEYPKININHSYNIDSIYGGYKRFSFPFNFLIKWLHPVYAQKYEGENRESPHFWGDVHKKLIKYNRNYETDQLNTIKFNPYMPYIDKSKAEYSNYWFSATFAPNQWVFNKIVSQRAVDRLEQENGICILFTHLGYYMKDGKINQGFQDKIGYISQKKSGWFVPVSTVLDYLMVNKGNDTFLPRIVKFKLELLYLFLRFKYGKILKLDDHTFKRSTEYPNR